MTLRQIGYWRSVRDTNPVLPDPRDFLDPGWDAEERVVVAEYLGAGRRRDVHLGSSRCRLCGRENGNATFTDDTYEWPEGLAHYVEDHALRLPVDFVAHVFAQIERDERVEIDREWWRAQQPTGTVRHWPHWQVTVGPCAEKTAEGLACIVAMFCERAAKELEQDFAGGRAITIDGSDRDRLDRLLGDLLGWGVAVEVVWANEPAPADLLG